VRVASSRPLPSLHARCRVAALRATLCLASASSRLVQVKRAPASVSLAAALVNSRVSATTLAPARLVECLSRGCGHILGMQRPSAPAVCFVHVGQAQHSSSGLRLWRFVARFGYLVSLGWYASASGPWRAKCRCNLTCRSTGRATARHPGREAALVHHPPRGQGASPPRAGYLYVRQHRTSARDVARGPGDTSDAVPPGSSDPPARGAAPG
jgi:hypothetical protein